MEIKDVSMEISEETIYYPGNPQPEIEKYRQIPEDSTTESRICFGSHTGTHVDALDLTGCREKVDREDLENEDITEDIVLLKTDNSVQGYEEFREEFTYLTLEGVEYLIDKGVKTVGIDYISLVEFDGGEKATEAHRKANQDMTVIEGLDLGNAEAGNYIFSGMPLKMRTDGAPMRAVIIDD